MNKKQWKTNYNWYDISIENSWSFESSEEKIILNNEIIYKSNHNLKEEFSIWLVFDFYIWEDKITIKLWNAWHLLGVACKILVNDKYFYWNKIVVTNLFWKWERKISK